MASSHSFITRARRAAQTLQGRLTGRAVFAQTDIAGAAETIVERALQRLKTTEKLIVAMGEHHHSEAHALTTAKVMKDLTAAGVPVTFALEQDTFSPLNGMLQQYYRVEDPAIRRVVAGFMDHLDQNGHQRAALKLAFGTRRSFAPLEVAVAHGLPVIYADAARHQKDLSPVTEIDLTHAPTRAVADDLGYTAIAEQSGQPIDAVSVMGTHLRNEYMLRAMEQTPGMNGLGPHIVVLQTGRTHVNGSSLTNAKEARMRASLGMPPRGICPSAQSLNHLSAQHRLAFQGVCMITGSEYGDGLGFRPADNTLYMALPDNDQVSERDIEALDLSLAPVEDAARLEVHGKEAIGQLAVMVDIVTKIGPAAFKVA